MKKIFCFSIILFLTFSLNVYADIAVELTLDRSSALLTDTVVMKVKVTGKRKSDFPDVDGLSSFDVVNGGTSSRLEIINGSMSSGVEYTFYLTPLKQGDFVIGPARVRVKKKAYASNSVKLTVSKERNDKIKNESASLFLKALISKGKSYVNQNVLYTLKLLRRKQVSDISLEMPEVEGLVFESLVEPKKYSTVIDAKRYEVIEIKYVLIPNKEGKYKIPAAAMRMTCYERSRRDSFFQDSFFNMSRGKPIYLSSNEIQLDVKKLPDLNRPDDFSGLVGRFEVKSKLDPTEVKTNESATLTITVKGTGNVRQIPDLKLSDIKGLKLYQDKPQLIINKGDSAIFGEKIMKWAIVPEKGGEYKIPAIGLSFFDPEQERYLKLRTEPFVLTAVDVSGEGGRVINALNADDNAAADSHAGGGMKKKEKQEIARIGKDIFPVHTSVDPIKGLKQQEFFNQIFIFLILAPPFICLLLFAGKKFLKNNNKNRFIIRSRNAKKKFMNKVRSSGIPMEKIHEAAIDYMNTRFLLKGGLLTSDEIHDLLLDKGVSSDTASIFKKGIASIESVIFTGEKRNNTDSIRDELIRAIKSIDREAQ
ncbi:MAG: protein BatD [Deltaproteobacteria bacterium]|nr:protein BatD [Deltaproteobacteria bacterium]